MKDKFHSKYKNKYRIESSRLNNWNYTWQGAYFITICTKDMQLFFGGIKDDNMILNEIGQVAERFWLEIPEHFDNIILDHFIIMPNHVHGILIINDMVETLQVLDVETLHCNVSTDKNEFFSKISPKPKSISTVIRSYKSICTKTINKIQNEVFFAWQTRFYDRIIRDEQELNNVRNYIENNPLNWKKNENYKS